MRYVTAGILIIGAVLGFTGSKLTAATPENCTTEQIQARIIATERPNMGELEREFWRAAITAAAQKHGVDPLVYLALVAEETRFKGHVTSHKGAKGAAQLMPVWSKGIDPFEIEANLYRGAEVLAKYTAEANDLRGGLRRYNGGPKGESIRSTAMYADAILARVYLAEKAVCQIEVKV